MVSVLHIHFVPFCMQPFFEDPEGKLLLPPCLKVHTWKRPAEFIVDKVTFMLLLPAHLDFALKTAVIQKGFPPRHRQFISCLYTLQG